MTTDRNPKKLITLRLNRWSLTGNDEARTYAAVDRYKSGQSYRSVCHCALQHYQNCLLGVEKDAKHYSQTPELSTATPYSWLKSP
jgi:hypothetical protein